jgi:selenocysteine lyase/cysteine desulfurase
MISPAEAREEFGPFEGRVWLNVAHQGPLPRPARVAVDDAAHDKAAPHRMQDSSFWELPAALRAALAPFIGAAPEEIILGNSTSYGLHLLSHGVQWRDGDEVLLVAGDFPATVVPWLWLRERGVRIRMIEPRTRPLEVAQLSDEISERTRLFCTSWVFSLTGEAVDIEAFGRLCGEREVPFVVNGTQGVGARALDVRRTPVDALVSCGFKWLCGPYAIGFCWIHPELLERLDYHQDYWLTQMRQSDLGHEGDYELRHDQGARRYDVFGTANFFNSAPWLAALDLLHRVGIDAIAAHDQRLVDVLVSELADSRRVRILSPLGGSARSAIVAISHADPAMNPVLYETLRAEGIDIALRAGNLRLSPHLRNGEDDVRRAVDAVVGHV